MSRASKRGWFVASAGVLALVVAGAACSKVAPNETTTDAGGTPPTEGDSSFADSGPGFTLDALPTTFDDATLPDDASDDAPVTPPADSGLVSCHKPSPGDPCGLDPQCDCPSQETCDLDGGEGTVCVVAGNALVGHGCTASASCAPGLTCSDGVCRPYCTLTSDAGCNAKLAEGGTCVSLTGSDAGPLAHYGTCSINCQLQDPNGCGATGDLNGGCISDNAGGTDCIGMGLTTIGGACTYINDCKPGLVCAGQCLQWCRIGHSPSDCGDGEACQTFGGGPVAANGVDYGYCP